MTLEEQFKQVLEHSQKQEFPHSDALIEQWRFAKEKLMRDFLDGKMIKEYPKKVTFELDDATKKQRYLNFIEYATNLYPDFTFIKYLEEHVTAKQFYNNSLGRDFRLADGKKIPKGTKIIRSFKHFIPDSRLLAQVQSYASKLIQENKVSGTLCLSAHPLDYLSSSENTLNWTSCHSLSGQYRSGNLSYMLDSSTLICYLRTDEPALIPNFPFSWNNKKWRCLLHVSDCGNMIIAGRQYPFAATSALETVRKAFLPKDEASTFFEPIKWSHWHNDYLSSLPSYTSHPEDAYSLLEDSYLFAQGQIFKLSDVVEDADLSTHYNDVLKSTIYTKPWYIFKKNYFLINNVHFSIGASAVCPRCGEHKILSPDKMYCPDCTQEVDNNEVICDICGHCYETKEDSFIRLCPVCAPRYSFYCEKCGQLELTANQHFENKQFICYNCWRKLNEKR